MTNPDSETTAPTGFAALGLPPALVGTLTTLGYEEPTPIQREAIPPLLAGRDVLGQAATGTGKTAAFALPLLVQRVRRLRRAQPPARAGPRADARTRDASRRGDPQVRQRAEGERPPDLRRAVDRRSSCARSIAASTSSSPRRAARSIT
jgi:superfamily II DNA/RNA helicase